MSIHDDALTRLRDTLPHALARPFLESLWTAPASVTVTAELARGVPSTLVSRFFRAGLQSPKRYLAETRLVRLRALLDDSAVELGDAAHIMRYSSCQSMHRHIRLMRGMSATAWRMRTTTAGELGRWFDTLVTPYVDTLQWFDPYTTTRDALLHAIARREDRAA